MKSFNIRVYGILINENKEVLVSDELIRDNRYTKFCGGGLEHGEGTINCLKREFREEMDLDIEVVEHVYTTDFFQQSLFNPQHQLISIYHTVQGLHPIRTPIRKSPFDFAPEQLEQHRLTGQVESFRFIPWERFSPDSMTLPIDKIAAKVVKQRYK